MQPATDLQNRPVPNTPARIASIRDVTPTPDPKFSTPSEISAGQPRRLVRGCGDRRGGGAAVLHHVGVFGRVLVELAEDGDSAEAQSAEEQLGGQVRLADLEHDPTAAGRYAGWSTRRELRDQLFGHLRADAAAAELLVDGEIEDVQ